MGRNIKVSVMVGLSNLSAGAAGYIPSLLSLKTINKTKQNNRNITIS